MEIVLLLSGFAFLLLGITILVQPKLGKNMPFGEILWLLAGFGILHGISEWLEMWKLIHGPQMALSVTRSCLLLLSFGFLFEFGRRLAFIAITNPAFPEGVVSKLLGWPLYAPIVGGLVFGGLINGRPGLVDLTIWAHYLMVFPAAVLIVSGVLLSYRSEAARLDDLRIKPYYLLAALAASAYGLLSGLVIPTTDYFPAGWLNYDSFRATVHAPVQVFLAICATLGTFALVNMLRIFNWEAEQQLGKALEEAQTSMARFQSLVESTSDWVWEVNRHGVYTYVSPQVTNLLGYTPEEVIGRMPFDFMPPSEAARVQVIFENIVLSRQPSYGLENTNIHKEGRLVILESGIVPFFDRLGDLAGYRGIDRDITERQASLQAIRDSEAKYRTLLENLPQVIFMKDRNSIFLSCNNNCARDLGIEPDQIVGRTDFDFQPKELAERYRQDDARIMDNGVLEELDEPYIKDGEELTIHTVKIPVRNEDGEVSGILGILWDITEKKRVEETLQRSEASLAEAQHLAQIGSWDFDLVKGKLFWSDEMYRIFGLDSKAFDATYETFLAAVHADDRERVDSAVKASINNRTPYNIEYMVAWPDGIERMVRARGTVMLDSYDGHPVRMVGTVQDVTEQRDSEVRLRQAAQVFENTNEGVMVTDQDQVILAVNPAFTHITGYSETEVIGKKPSLLHSGRQDETFYRNLNNSIKTTGNWQGEIWNRRKDGEVYIEWLTISTVRDNTGKPINHIGVFSDISAIRQSQDKLIYAAHHDALTNLPNRILLRDRLVQALATARRNATGVAVFFIDLDHFKLINDTLGHEAGDVLLKEVASRLVNCLREEDTVARMGGDEFVLIQAGLTQPHDAGQLASRLLRDVCQPVSIAGHDIVVSISIGISLYPENGEDISDLLKYADAAMYRAKEEGRNCFRYYSDEMTVQAQARFEMESDLRQALEREEFVLHYQPQVDIKDGHIIGVEALIRWQHPARGMILPGLFISLAEDIGLIGSIGEWVINTACAQAKAWQTSGLPPIRIAVNISGRQVLHDHLAGVVSTALQTSGLDPQFLELEVTESILMTDADQAVSTLNVLKRLGVMLSIDDFGTGYSSLSYLKRFPIDKLKIDKSFVDGLPDNPDDSAIAVAIIAMAHSLKLVVIAEGVETEAQLKFLRSHGCDEIQGFYFSRGLPAQQLAKLFSGEHRPISFYDPPSANILESDTVLISSHA